MTRLTIADLDIERPSEGLEIEMEDGTVYVLQDPKALSLSEMASQYELTTVEQVKAMIAEDKWDQFTGHPEVNGYFFEAVMRKYTEHFGKPASITNIAQATKATKTTKGAKK